MLEQSHLHSREESFEGVLKSLSARIQGILGNNRSIAFVYGSSVQFKEGMADSDVDLIVISAGASEDVRLEVANAVVEFHREFDLYLDYAVPYSNKIVYDFNDCKMALQGEGFLNSERNYEIQWCDNSEYLRSEAFRLRLLTTALATKKRLLWGVEKDLEILQVFAWRKLIEVVQSSQFLENDSLDRLVAAFQIGDVKTPFGSSWRTYKDYLGFPNDKEFREYIRDSIVKANSIGVDWTEVEKLAARYSISEVTL